MLANRKRSRDVLHDFNNSVDVEDNELELQPTTKRPSLGWFSSRFGRLAGRLYRAMKKWIGSESEGQEEGETPPGSPTSISPDIPLSTLSLDDSHHHTTGPTEHSNTPNMYYDKPVHRRNIPDPSTPELTDNRRKPTNVGNMAATTSLATPLFNKVQTNTPLTLDVIERQHYANQYCCVMSTWTAQKSTQKMDTASIHTVLRENAQVTTSHFTPPLAPNKVQKWTPPTPVSGVQLWSGDPATLVQDSRRHGRREEHSDKGTHSSLEGEGTKPPADRFPIPLWAGAVHSSYPVYHSIQTGRQEQYQTMIQHLKKDIMDERKDSEVQKTALEKIITLAREEREKFVDVSAKKVLKDDKDETEMSLTLSPQQENTVREVWSYGNEDDTYCTGFSIAIKRCDLQTLVPSVWLNDAVMNFYFNLIAQRSQQKDSICRAHCMRTFFYPKLLDSGYSGVRRWTKKVDIFKDFDIVIVPVHLGVHWTLAVVDMKKKQVVYYDSLLGDNMVCTTALLDWLVQEAKDKKGMSYDVSDWKKIAPKDIPRQQNSSDCGVFTCMFARYYTRNRPFTFKQMDMSLIRKQMVCEIIEQRLF